MALRSILFFMLLSVVPFTQVNAEENPTPDLMRLACFQRDLFKEQPFLDEGKLLVVTQTQVDYLDDAGAAQTFYGYDFLKENSVSPKLAFHIKIYDFGKGTPRTQSAVEAIVKQNETVAHLGVPAEGMNIIAKKTYTKFVGGHVLSTSETIVVQTMQQDKGVDHPWYGSLRNQITKSNINGITHLKCLSLYSVPIN